MSPSPVRVRSTSDCALVFASALAFYWVTLAPGVIWGDSAALALDAFYGSLHLETASDHPLFVFVGELFTALPGEVARNVNFEAACFGALAVMLVYRFARRLGTSRLAAAVGAAALCVSHTFWLHSVVAEVYTANAFFLAATLNLLLEWKHRQRWPWLAAAGMVFAVGLTNHLMLAAMAPATFVFVVATKRDTLLRRRSLAYLALLLVAAFALAIAWPGSLGATLSRIWYGPPGIAEYFGLQVAPIATAREAGYYLLYLIYQFPSVALVLGAAGILVLLREQLSVAVLLLLTVAVNAFIFIRHTVWPSAGNAKYVFYIPDYVVFAIMCAVGANEVMRRIATRPASQRRALAVAIFASAALMPPAVYAAMPWAVRTAGVDLVYARSLPYRDNNRFFLNPNKRWEDGPRRYGEEALDGVPPGAVIFADYTPFMVLRYLQVVEHRRPDVLLGRPRSAGDAVHVTWMYDGARRRPTYVTALIPGYYDLSGLTGAYDLVPAGTLIEVRPQ